MNAIFEIRDIRAGYGEREVVHGVSFSLRPGELGALLGLNGSGKTTLLRSVCGLLPSTGERYVQGVSLQGLSKKEQARRLSFVPQTPSPIEGKTVLEVLLMGANPHLKLLESPGEVYKQKARAALALLGLEAFETRFFHTLSQGQKQLIILARTLVQDAPVMLMDEPDSALDFLNRHMVLGKIRKLVETQQRGGLITLHDPNFAMAYCHRLFLLKEGTLVDILDMTTASRQEAEDKLSLLYGPICLLEQDGCFLMGKRSGAVPAENQ